MLVWKLCLFHQKNNKPKRPIFKKDWVFFISIDLKLNLKYNNSNKIVMKGLHNEKEYAYKVIFYLF